ncbi:MAG: hypothetical protein U5K37_09660 [Natrialbaceae archaeon]|nr:hypothetical protein [Natrialbaceae archaeon]
MLEGLSGTFVSLDSWIESSDDSLPNSLDTERNVATAEHCTDLCKERNCRGFGQIEVILLECL